ncbi:hypothetical protein JTB14_027721 [Gonioctena quinquepunctata]|nr:hypothetical protein JTB14_027721 [Gonioctena quinquepunctata]
MLPLQIVTSSYQTLFLLVLSMASMQEEFIYQATSLLEYSKKYSSRVKIPIARIITFGKYFKRISLLIINFGVFLFSPWCENVYACAHLNIQFSILNDELKQFNRKFAEDDNIHMHNSFDQKRINKKLRRFMNHYLVLRRFSSTMTKLIYGPILTTTFHTILFMACVAINVLYNNFIHMGMIIMMILNGLWAVALAEMGQQVTDKVIISTVLLSGSMTM